MLEEEGQRFSLLVRLFVLPPSKSGMFAQVMGDPPHPWRGVAICYLLAHAYELLPCAVLRTQPFLSNDRND